MATTEQRRRQPRMPIEVRREQVLDAALRLISRDGYGAATMEAIAREAEIAKPVVYNAFGGRGPLLRALLEREERKALATLAAAMPDDPADAEPAALLGSWLRSLCEAIAADPEPWRLMLIPGAETPKEVRDHVDAGREVALTQLRALFAPLVAGGRGTPALDPDLCAHAALGAAEHCARLMLSDPETYPPKRMIQFGEALISLLPAEMARTGA